MKDIPMIDPVTELKKLFDAKKFDSAIEFCQKLLEKDQILIFSYSIFLFFYQHNKLKLKLNQKTDILIVIFRD